MITRTKRPMRGFTLTELLVVIVIVGLLMAFILIAVRDGVRTAMEKATYSLIVKLETGLNERLEAILAQRGEVTQAHENLASIYLNATAPPLRSPQRAQVIAQFDQVRAEVPDVFVINPAPLNSHYPFNFSGIPFPLAGSSYDYFVLPLGKGLNFDTTNGYTPKVPREPGSGIFGASYSAAAGIYKNLGYLPAGYDGVDNNGDGFVDDLAEGIGSNPTVPDPDDPSAPNITVANLVSRRIGNHTHNTARSEMLYALLVEGQGSIGSVFSRDDFTASEVQDTDHDGLPEFVDAWGEPLRFYRWPLYYSPVNIGGGSTYIQKGSSPYVSTETRQNDPLDPSQLLVAPSWWWSSVNQVAPPGSGFSGAGKLSGGAVAFMTYFHTLIDNHPSWSNGSPAAGQAWDRSSFLPRRAYYSRPLIISSGPDKMLGVAELGTDYRSIVPSTLPLFSSSDNSGATVGVSALNCMQIENLASQFDPNRVGLYGVLNNSALNQTDAFLSGTASQDDVSNQALSSPGGGIR